jgi:predicted kinase
VTYLVHLICGSTGAGKTTYALALTERLGAVRFSIDEWMSALYWMDTPQPLVPAWSLERVARCNAQIWTTAVAVAKRGVPCVLDLGLGEAASRAHFVRMADAEGLSVQLHCIDVPAEERWRRVQMRNAQKGASHQLPFDVTREMFDFVEAMFEPPTEEEMSRCNGLRVRGEKDDRTRSG